MGLYKFMGAQFRRPSGLIGRLVGFSMGRGHKRIYDWTLGLIDIQPADHLLDIGCGNGMAIKLIAERVVEGFAAGIDHSETMVQQSLKLNRANVRAGRVEIISSNVSALPYEDESFDKVCAIESFYFWPDPVANLEEVLRVLKPGGLTFIAMEMSKEMANPQKGALFAAKLNFPIYSGAEIEELLTKAGFSQARFECDREDKRGRLCALGVK